MNHDADRSKIASFILKRDHSSCHYDRYCFVAVVENSSASPKPPHVYYCFNRRDKVFFSIPASKLKMFSVFTVIIIEVFLNISSQKVICSNKIDNNGVADAQCFKFLLPIILFFNRLCCFISHNIHIFIQFLDNYWAG